MTRYHDQEKNPSQQTSGSPGANGGEGNGADGNGTLVPIPPHQLALPADGGPTESSGLNYKALLNALRRRWFLAVSLALVLGSAAAAGAWYFIPAPYTALSEIQIKSTGNNFLFKTAEERTSFQVYKQNQMKQVKGPFVLNAALRDHPDVAKTRLIQQQEYPLDWLEENLQVRSGATEYFTISLSGEDPKALQTIVKAVTDSYLKEVVYKDKSKRQQRLEHLRKVLAERQEELDGKRRNYDKIAETQQTANKVQLDQKQQYLLDRNLELQNQMMQADLELINAKIQLAYLQDRADGLDDIDIPDEQIDAQISGLPEYQEVAVRVGRLERRLEAGRKTLTPNHPQLLKTQQDLAKAQQELDALRKELKPMVIERIGTALTSQGQMSETQIKERIAALESWKDGLNDNLAEVKREVAKHGLYSLQLQTLERDIAQDEAVVKAIADEVSRLEVEVKNAPDTIQVFREAEVPHARDFGKKTKGTALAGLGVFGLIIAGITFLEYRSTRISSLDEVADGLNIRVIGALPNMPRKSKATKNGQKATGRRAFWHSVLTESIDSTRTILLREARLDSLQTLMVTSAIGGEGKTTLSCHLATSLARSGRNTLLVDCDMRRPSVHKVFDDSLTPGFSELLRGETTVEEAVQPGPRDGLSVLPAGKIDQKVLRLLTEDRLGEVFDELKQNFDFVVVDSSPLLPVTDSLLLAQYIDGVLFSIRKDVSRAAKVAAACQRMAMLGVPVLGAVAIGLDDGSYGYRHPYRYGYYGYRHGNGAAYGQRVAPSA